MLKQAQTSGFSMVEVLVTIAITTVGLLGLSSLQLQSMRATQDTGNRSQAIWMINDLKGRIRANEIALRNHEYRKLSGNKYLKCSERPTHKNCSNHHTGANKISISQALECNAKEVAEEDVWNTLCGSTINGYATSSADFIANPELKITKADNNDITLSLRWDSQNSGYDSAGNKVFSTNSNTVTKSSRQQSEYRTTFRP